MKYSGENPMSDGWNIALLGATGAVGEALLELLQERQFPVGELYPLASERSAGANVRFNGKSLLVQNAEEFDWSQAQLAFFVAGSDASARYAEEAGNMGCLVIDTSGLFAMEPDVPLVVPGVNPQVLADYRNRNIVAVADSMVSQLLTAIKPLTEQAGLSRLHVTTLMSVSSRGKAAVDDLAGQSARLLNGIPAEEGVFAKQLAFNLLPLVADEQGSVREERLIADFGELRSVAGVLRPCAGGAPGSAAPAVRRRGAQRARRSRGHSAERRGRLPDSGNRSLRQRCAQHRLPA
jgi:aspartate-semialdehyde dehydrogenase